MLFSHRYKLCTLLNYLHWQLLATQTLSGSQKDSSAFCFGPQSISSSVHFFGSHSSHVVVHCCWHDSSPLVTPFTIKITTTDMQMVPRILRNMIMRHLSGNNKMKLRLCEDYLKVQKISLINFYIFYYNLYVTYFCVLSKRSAGNGNEVSYFISIKVQSKYQSCYLNSILCVLQLLFLAFRPL